MQCAENWKLDAVNLQQMLAIISITFIQERARVLSQKADF